MPNNQAIRSKLSISILLYTCSSILLAQNVPNAGSNIVNPLTNTDVIRRELPEPLSRPDKIVLPVLTHDTKIEGADKIKFTLKELSFEGNKVISDEQLLQIFADSFNKEISVADLLELIKKVTIFYKDQGYILSQAFLPDQKIENPNNAKIKIGIIEGHVSKYLIRSEILQPTTIYLLEQYAQKIVNQKPLTRAVLERYALFMDDIPGANIKVVFHQSDEKGAADIEIIADDAKIFGFDAFTNNRGTRAIGPQEHSLSLYQFNGFYGNKSSVTKTFTENDELILYTYKHRQPLNSDGLTLNFIATRSKTKPDFRALPAINRSTLEIPGKSNTYLAELEYGAIRSRLQNLLLKLKFSATDNDSTLLGQPLFREKLRMLKFEIIYDWLDNIFFDIFSHNLISAEFTQGVNAFGAYIRPDKGLATRPNVEESFSKFNLYLSRTQPLFPLVKMRLQGLGQFANDELVSSEEFGYGGRIIGLGYDSFQIAGDHGIAGKIELSLDLPFSYLVNYSALKSDSYFYSQLLNFVPALYAFYDGGRVWNRNYRSSSQKEHDSAVSRGFGIRGTFANLFIFDGYMAEPVTRVAQNEQDKQPRYFFNVGILYE